MTEADREAQNPLTMKDLSTHLAKIASRETDARIKNFYHDLDQGFRCLGTRKRDASPEALNAMEIEVLKMVVNDPLEPSRRQVPESLRLLVEESILEKMLTTAAADVHREIVEEVAAPAQDSGA